MRVRQAVDLHGGEQGGDEYMPKVEEMRFL